MIHEDSVENYLRQIEKALVKNNFLCNPGNMVYKVTSGTNGTAITVPVGAKQIILSVVSGTDNITINNGTTTTTLTSTEFAKTYVAMNLLSAWVITPGAGTQVEAIYVI